MKSTDLHKINSDDVYKTILLLINSWKNPSVRNIAKLFSKENSLRTIQNHISNLIDKDMVYRDEKWKLQITNNIFLNKNKCW